MPILSSQVYDRYGQVYNVTRVIQNSFNFNSTAYEEYSPVYIPSTYSIVYAISFALATSAITHTALYHGRSIIDKIKNVKTEAEDVHAKLMRNYPEVPDWWYWIYLIIFVALAIVSITVSPSPWRCIFEKEPFLTPAFSFDPRYLVAECPSGGCCSRCF